MLILIILLFLGVALLVSITLDLLGLASFHLKTIFDKISGSNRSSGKSDGKAQNKTTVRTESAVNKGKKKIQANQGEYIDYTDV